MAGWRLLQPCRQKRRRPWTPKNTLPFKKNETKRERKKEMIGREQCSVRCPSVFLHFNNRSHQLFHLGDFLMYNWSDESVVRMEKKRRRVRMRKRITDTRYICENQTKKKRKEKKEKKEKSVVAIHHKMLFAIEYLLSSLSERRRSLSDSLRPTARWSCRRALVALVLEYEIASCHIRWTSGIDIGAYYRKRGSASYIVREVLSVRERERDTDRQRERERERERERRKWRHHCRAKIGDEFTLSLAKNSHFSFLPSHFPSLPSRRGHHGGAEIRNEFTLSIAKNFSPSGFVPPLSNGTSRTTSDRKPKTKDQILPSPIFLPIEKMNQINTKNYWKQKKRLCVRWLGVINLTWENLQIAKHKSGRQFSGLICALRSVDFLR